MKTFAEFMKEGSEHPIDQIKALIPDHAICTLSAMRDERSDADGVFPENEGTDKEVEVHEKSFCVVNTKDKSSFVKDMAKCGMNCDHRLHHIKQKPKNWKAFDVESEKDQPILPVAAIYDAMNEVWHDIVFVTGRNERNRKRTLEWLEQNIDYKITNEQLYMRPYDDYRQDDVVKENILADIVEKYDHKPDMVFEDRARVLSMWRRNGVFTFDVNQTGEVF